MEKRAHHYIPQFYLRNFTDPLTPSKHTPYLWIIDLKEKTLSKKSPKNIGYIRGFNDILDNNGDILTDVEDDFGKIENESARLLKKIIKLEYLSRSERINFSKFVFSMRARVPAFIELVKKLLLIEEFRERIKSETNYEAIPNTIEMDAIIRTTHVASYVLLNMTWTLVLAPEGSNFVTSDNPVVITDPSNEDSFFNGFTSSPTVQLTFPLSPKICLLGTWSKKMRLLWNADTSVVRGVNSLTLRNSHRYVFSSSDEVESLF